ncbi:phage tail protein [Pseudomonas sp. NY15374]|uniref:phage tail protein n=1 Tax=Pseudomonas sp. NY15374 TaxID=3400357 RepID=UPI003A8750FA
MADQNTQFYAILTNVGAAKQANADALGIPWRITQLGVGDANGTEPTPNATQTRLINEWRRAPLNQLKVDDKNNAIIVAEQVIPAEVGGKWIREIALYDADGDMVAVANCPPTYKPLLNQGSGRTQVVRMNLLVSSSSNVELRIDPSVVLATREYVDSRLTEEINKLDNKQSVRVATTANITLTGLQTVDGVLLLAGDRVLVKNQAAAKDNGLYTAAVGSWSRSSDADASTEVTPGLIVAVEQGAILADTIWQLITDAPIVLGTTALVFRDVTDGFARLLSPAFTGQPTTPTPPQFDSSQLLVNTAFLKRMGVEYGGYTNFSGSASLTQAECGKLVALGHPTTPVTATLPTGAQIKPGAIVKLLCSQGSLTVTAASGDTIGAINAPGNIAMGQGDTAEFIRNGTNLWYLIGGSVLLRYAAVMQEASWSTQPQFDSGRSLATTEFVQRALGSFSGATTYGANVTLTKADAGKLIRMAGTGYTLTLPLISTLVEGATFAIQHSGTSGTQTVAVQGGDVIDPGAGLVTSLTLNKGDTAILARAGGSWALIGGSAALSFVDRPTLPQFDNSRQLATTEFVQRALGSFSGSLSISASRALTVADLGKRIELAANTTVTLPDTSTVPLGAAVLISAGPVATTARVTVVASDQLAMNNLGVAVPYTLAAGGDFIAIREMNVWRCHFGTEPLRTSPLFAASLAVTGYSKLPNGDIEMWGLTGGAAPGVVMPITFPQAFPNACLNVQMTYVDAGTQAPATRGGPVQVGAFTKTGFNYSHSGSSSASQHFWRAKGY